MIALNGALTNVVGLYSSTVIIHLVGMSIMIATMIVKKINPFKNFQPWYYYIGGAMGIIATVGNNYSFEFLGVSAILALGLIGQSITGLVIDSYGLFGMKKYPMNVWRIIPVIIMFIGAGFMIRTMDILSMVLSTLVGVALVMQRVANSNLSERTSLEVAVSYTYFTALVGCIAIFLMAGQGEPIVVQGIIPTDVWLYLGGAVGVVTVYLSTICVSKVAGYSLSLLMFIGQVFAGVVIDSLLLGELSTINIVGGVVVTIGMVVDIFIVSKSKAKIK